MELDWSEQSPHIRTLYCPWQPGDGCDEADIQEAEARLSLRLPAKLRNFYLAWGQRRDLTNGRVYLVRLENLEVRSGALVVYTEAGSSWLWAMQCKTLEEPNPAICYGFSRRVGEGWLAPLPVQWHPSYARLSDLLDDMTYTYALIGCGLHGGKAMAGEPDLPPPPLKEYQRKWLERHWQKIAIKVVVTGRRPAEVHVSRPLYVRDGQVLDWKSHCMAAVRETEALDQIAWALQLQWYQRW